MEVIVHETVEQHNDRYIFLHTHNASELNKMKTNDKMRMIVIAYWVRDETIQPGFNRRYNPAKKPPYSADFCRYSNNQLTSLHSHYPHASQFIVISLSLAQRTNLKTLWHEQYNHGWCRDAFALPGAKMKLPVRSFAQWIQIRCVTRKKRGETLNIEA